MKWVYDDGGRRNYFKGEANDCATRAISIASGMDYKVVYNELFEMTNSSPRNGVSTKELKKYLDKSGWTWVPTMRVGQGCTVHVTPDELPNHSRLILNLSKHVSAVIDGVLRDTHDSSRGGTRCVYGYWYKESYD